MVCASRFMFCFLFRPWCNIFSLCLHGLIAHYVRTGLELEEDQLRQAHLVEAGADCLHPRAECRWPVRAGSVLAELGCTPDLPQPTRRGMDLEFRRVCLLLESYVLWSGAFLKICRAHFVNFPSPRQGTVSPRHACWRVSRWRMHRTAREACAARPAWGSPRSDCRADLVCVAR